MGNIDLTGVAKFNMDYVLDEDTNILTVTLTNNETLAAIGTITLENEFLKPFVEAMNRAAQERLRVIQISQPEIIHRRHVLMYVSQDEHAEVTFI